MDGYEVFNFSLTWEDLTFRHMTLVWPSSWHMVQHFLLFTIDLVEVDGLPLVCIMSGSKILSPSPALLVGVDTNFMAYTSFVKDLTLSLTLIKVSCELEARLLNNLQSCMRVPNRTLVNLSPYSLLSIVGSPATFAFFLQQSTIRHYGKYPMSSWTMTNITWWHGMVNDCNFPHWHLILTSSYQSMKTFHEVVGFRKRVIL